MARPRPSFITATTGSLTVFARSIRAQERDVEFAFRQYHNQTPESSLHKRLVQMWQAVYDESGGFLFFQGVGPKNKNQGGEPAGPPAAGAGGDGVFSPVGGHLPPNPPGAAVEPEPSPVPS